MVLRVPVTELTSTLRSIKDLADEVVSESQQAQDVSEQFVDLEARLVNLEALETELRALLEEVRAQPDADPEKLLRVFNELAAVRGQIEQIQGQIDYLSNQTDLATVQVGLTQTPLAVPVVEEPWAPAEAAKEAARSLVSTLQSLADWVIGFVIYTLPILILVLTAPLLLAFLVYRRMRPDPAPSNPPATVEP
jgi:DNA repair exonuclease SbcCD ATPase subunit